MPKIIPSLHTRICQLPLEDNEGRSILRDFLTSDQLKQLALLQRTLGAETELTATSFGYLQARTTAQYCLFVFGILDDEVVGYAACLPVDYCGQRHALVTEVIVRGEYQARGFGRQLVDAIGGAIRQQESVEAFRAVVDASNNRARQLFTRSGYEAIAFGQSFLFDRSIARA